MAKALEINNLSFAYQKQSPVLENINLDVEQGKVLCILGSNGCGKSTLLNAILGNNLASSGEVKIFGQDIKAMSPLDLAQKVAMVFQEHLPPFPYSVFDVVKMGRAPYLQAFGILSKKDRQIAYDALAAVGFEHLLDKPYTNISGGERQLVLIARALCQQTDLILMDEPTSHLDFKNQALIMKIAYKLAKEKNITIVMTTHIPHHVWLYPAKVALIKDGKILASGESMEIMTEQNLQKIYNMQVKVLKNYDPDLNKEFITCIPVLN